MDRASKVARRVARIEFVVGEHETHRVDFTFDKFWGYVGAAVDGVPIIADVRFLSLARTKRYAFDVGSGEQHAVVVEMERKIAFAGVRPYTFRVTVDGSLVLTREQ